MEKASLMKTMGVWAGSFAIAAIVLFFYFHVPPHILLFAGIGTLLITLIRFISQRNRRPS